MLLYWWRSLTKRDSSQSRRGRRLPGHGSQKRTSRPEVELLEARTLLSSSGGHLLPHGLAYLAGHTGVAHPNFVLPSNVDGPQPFTSGPGGGYTPATLATAYGLNLVTFNNGTVNGDGTGQTIAIIDAYDDPNIVSDLTTFDKQYFPNGPAVNTFFTKVAEDGTSNYPGTDPSGGGWEVEESLDVEWAHAIAPGAKILLVEANTNLDGDLNIAIDFARNDAGVSVVSMSFGGGESSSEANSDFHYTTPSGHGGVTFVASSGDSGAPVSYPAISPNVVSIGGTVLNVTNANAWSSETGWSGSGGGISSYEAQPSYQKGVTDSFSNTYRANPDVASDAAPNTGASIYDSFPYNGRVHSWWAVGGTSFSAPTWAGIMAIVDQGLAQAGKGSYDGATQTLPKLYALPSADFHDITSGTSTGSPNYSAGNGYDLVTGLGTPIANKLIPDLIGAVASTTDTWTGKGPDNKWSDPNNWLAGTAPNAGDSLVFGPNESQLSNTNDFASGTQFGTLTLSSSGYTLSGNDVNLTGGIDASSATGSNTVNLNVKLANAETFNIAASGTQAFGGNINTNGYTLTVGGGAGSGTFSGVISGSGGLTTTYSGTVTLAGNAANTYSGATTVNSGTLLLNDSAGSAIVGSLTVGDGAGVDTVRLSANNQLGANVTVTVNSSGTLDLNNNSTTISTLTLSSGTITTGTGTLTLSADVTSSGTSSISGNLALGSATRNFTVSNSSDTLTISAVISGTGGLTNAGSGTLALTGSNTYSGGTNQNKGTLQVGNNNALGTGTLTLNAGTLSASVATTLGNAVTLAADITVGGSNNLTLSGAVSLTGNRTLTLTNTGTTTLSGVISESGGSRSLTETGAGTLVLSGANTFTGGTIVRGTLQVGNNNALGTGQLDIKSATLSATGGAITLANSVLLGEKVTIAGSQNLTFTGGFSIYFNRPITVTNTGLTTIAGVISETYAGSRFGLSGTGTLVLSGANTYTGATSVNGGTLVVTGSISSKSAITVSNSATLGGTGTVGAVTVSAGGTVLPGTSSASTGILSTGAITFQSKVGSASNYNVTLNSATAGSGYDQVKAIGAVTLGSSNLKVTLGFTPGIGTSFTIISNLSGSSVSGTFSGLAEGATFAVGSETFQITYKGGASGKDVVITRTA